MTTTQDLINEILDKENPLMEIVDQLHGCNFECEAGLLTNNIYYKALVKMSENPCIELSKMKGKEFAIQLDGDGSVMTTLLLHAGFELDGCVVPRHKFIKAYRNSTFSAYEDFHHCIGVKMYHQSAFIK